MIYELDICLVKTFVPSEKQPSRRLGVSEPCRMVQKDRGCIPRSLRCAIATILLIAEVKNNIIQPRDMPRQGAGMSETTTRIQCAMQYAQSLRNLWMSGYKTRTWSKELDRYRWIMSSEYNLALPLIARLWRGLREVWAFLEIQAGAYLE